MRTLTEREVEFVALARDAEKPYALVHMTSTMLGKSISDATFQVRELFLEMGLHDYRKQSQGEAHKVISEVYLVLPDMNLQKTSMSMYRPPTKSGDPRFHIYGIANHCKPDDILMFVNAGSILLILNLSNLNLDQLKTLSLSGERVFQAALALDAIRDDLVERLRDISSRGFIDVYRDGPTGIGHLLETELGIEANSAQAPDFGNAIELKATRTKVSRGKTLFARVADWKISQLKSSAEILDKFGYERIDSKGKAVRSLNCSVEYDRFNTQGLGFEIDHDLGFLKEVSNDPNVPVVAIWPIDGLLEKLREKHKRTMWVQGISRKEHGREQIKFVEAQYTSEPVLDQFIPMLKDRMVYMDHLISRKNGKVSEQGPLFKIRPQSFGRLFPEQLKFDLVFD
ncbi:MvaI/BcnI family restriction endonuclease [Glutamicibacter protophormiae]|uniref:MvaI/BcnI family restriction endonuclease n=1 Tax=Glutamicibacter protophormiae TaxID=37930 RepID=UPI001957F86A|nr:MvaI/BcnI family restriction endonuclease [Glutamicibacter protophormiae]QRQ78325.1 hypothetical protein JQN66_15685 [Glutamicibacter protophormiae]